MKRIILLLIFLSTFIILVGYPFDPMRSSVQALLDDERISSKILSCRGSWSGIDGERRMYCLISFKDADLEGFRALGDLMVTKSSNPCDNELRLQQAHSVKGVWPSSRHGFYGATSILNEESKKLCLHLSIAYG